MQIQSANVQKCVIGMKLQMWRNIAKLQKKMKLSPGKKKKKT
jgi:hypothetical protein